MPPPQPARGRDEDDADLYDGFERDGSDGLGRGEEWELERQRLRRIGRDEGLVLIRRAVGEASRAGLDRDPYFVDAVAAGLRSLGGYRDCVDYVRDAASIVVIPLPATDAVGLGEDVGVGGSGGGPWSSPLPRVNRAALEEAALAAEALGDEESLSEMVDLAVFHGHGPPVSPAEEDGEEGGEEGNAAGAGER